MDLEPFTGELLEQLDSGVTALQLSWCRMLFPLIECDAGTRLWAAPVVSIHLPAPIPSGHKSKNCYTWYLQVIRGNTGKLYLSARCPAALSSLLNPVLKDREAPFFLTGK